MRSHSERSWRWVRRWPGASDLRFSTGTYAAGLCADMPLTPSGYALLGLTAIVAVMTASLTFAVLRFAAAARDASRHARTGHGETALLSAALEEAVATLKAQERVTAARADASERLSGE